MSNDLRLRDLRVSLRGEQICAVDCTVAPGSVLTVMGPSGTGKSTLLSAISGTLDRVFEMTGQVMIAGRDVTGLPTEQRRIGVMFQDPLLFPHLSVGQNLAFGLAPGGSRTDRRLVVDKALAEVELAGYANRDPAALSGGQAIRVALMRTMLSAPRALLLDEPFSKLDTDLRTRVRAMVLGQVRQRGIPAVLVTHDPEDARAAGGNTLRIG